MIKQFCFKQIQVSISSQFKGQTILFDPKTGPYQVLPLSARVGLGAMTMKGYSLFPKAPALLEPRLRLFSCHI